MALEQRNLNSMERAEKRPPAVLQAVIATEDTSASATPTAPSAPSKSMVTRRASGSRLGTKISPSGGGKATASAASSAVQVAPPPHPYPRPTPSSVDVPNHSQSSRSSSGFLSHSHSSPPVGGGRLREQRSTRSSRARAAEICGRRDPPRPPQRMLSGPQSCSQRMSPARRISLGCPGKDAALGTGIASPMMPPLPDGTIVETPRGAQPSARRAYSPTPDCMVAGPRALSAPPNGILTPTASLVPAALSGSTALASLRVCGGASPPHPLPRQRTVSPARSQSPVRPPLQLLPSSSVFSGASLETLAAGGSSSTSVPGVQRLSSSPSLEVPLDLGLALPSTVGSMPSCSTYWTVPSAASAGDCISISGGSSRVAVGSSRVAVGSVVSQQGSLVSPRNLVSPRGPRSSSGSVQNAVEQAAAATVNSGVCSLRAYHPSGRLSIPQQNRPPTMTAQPVGRAAGSDPSHRRLSSGSPLRSGGQNAQQRQSGVPLVA